MRREEKTDPRLSGIFLRCGRKRTCSPGQLLVEKGQPATDICFIVSGQARTFCMNPDGDNVTLFYIEADNMICSEALLLDAVVRVSVQAMTPLELRTIPAREFLRHCEEEDFPVTELFRPLIARLTLLSDYICCAHFRENSKKVAYFLHSCYNRSGEVISFTHEQIADIIGINRVSVNRILNGFARDGILELEYRKIRILDVQRLRLVFHSIGYFID